MLNAAQLAQQATLIELNINTQKESSTPSEVTSGVYQGYSNGAYSFSTVAGGTVRVEILSTVEPIIGQSYLIQKDQASDVAIAKPKPRL